MTKAIKTAAHITSIRSRKDRSIGFSVETPELTDEQAVAFFKVQGKNLNMLIEPEDGSSELIEVTKPLEGKSQSQRIRAIIFIHWKQDGEPGIFESYYYEKTEKYIEFLKEKLE